MRTAPGWPRVSLSRPAYSGWEDAAVPPERLGAWLRDFDELLREHDLDGVPYGHFGDGCVHVRIDFPFSGGRARSSATSSPPVPHKLREHGGSLSGEHGDGRARSELLSIMYDEESIALFGAVKAICDPGNLLNPGNIVDPAPLDADLRPTRPRHAISAGLKLVHDDGVFGNAVHRCTGVGKCVAPKTNGVMCPSYLATRDEKDSTRGRSRVLQEALDGSLVGGLADPAVGEALDLCLACKGCASDCPTGVDMATYKAEALHQKHDVLGEKRPRSHYLLGRLPKWAALAAPMAPVANRMMRLGPVARLAKATAGIDQRRSIPAFAPKTLRRSVGDSPDVVPGRVDLGRLLQRPLLPGQRARGDPLPGVGRRHRAGDRRRRLLRPDLDHDRPARPGALDHGAHGPHAHAVRRVGGAGRRPRAVLPGDPAQRRRRADRREPRRAHLRRAGRAARPAAADLAGVEVVAQPHCHQASILGWAADKRILERAGATVTQVAGCCGLAGNFGMEKGHYEVSVAVAETHLLPAVRANPDAVVLADGMSCRVQLDDLADSRRCTSPSSSLPFARWVREERRLPGFRDGLGDLLNHRIVARGEHLDSRGEPPPPSSRHPDRTGGAAADRRDRGGVLMAPSEAQPLLRELNRLRSLILDPAVLVKAVASGRQKGEVPTWRRAELRYVDLKAGTHLQITTYDQTQAFTENHAVGDASRDAVDALLDEPFGDWHVDTATQSHRAQGHQEARGDRAHDRPGSAGSSRRSGDRGTTSRSSGCCRRTTRCSSCSASPTTRARSSRAGRRSTARSRSSCGCSTRRSPRRSTRGTCAGRPPRTRCGSSTWAAATPT